MIQCPKCVTFAMQDGRLFKKDDFPMSKNPNGLFYSCANGHELSRKEAEGIMTQNAKILPRSEKGVREPKVEAVEGAASPSGPGRSSHEWDSPMNSQQVSGLPLGGNANGDYAVRVAIREAYVVAVQTLASESGKTVEEWAQERMDYYMESEFSTLRIV